MTPGATANPVALPAGMGGGVITPVVPQSVEMCSVCESDIATPLWLRGGGVRQDPDTVPDLPQRRLFQFDSNDDGYESQAQDNMETESLASISTIESPADGDLSYYMTDRSSDEEAFSTGVSSTRKRRANK